MQRILYFTLIFFLVAGCENGQIALTEEARSKIKENKNKQAEKRHEVFIQCMEIATRITRPADDDVSDIVDSCGNQSYYISNQYDYDAAN